MWQILKFGADGTAYTRDLNKMRQQTKKFAGSVKGLFLGAFGAASVAAGMKNVIDKMTEMKRQADRLGISVNSFHKLSYAAKQVGVDSEGLADAMKDLRVKITDAAETGAAFNEVLVMLGLDAQKLVDLPMDEQMLTFADAVSKADAATQAFALDEVNDQMFQLILLMKDGREGIEALTEGFTGWTEAQVEAAERANIQVSSAIDNMTAQLGVWLSKALNIFEWLVTGATQAFTEIVQRAKDTGELLAFFLDPRNAFKFEEKRNMFDKYVKDGEEAASRIKKAMDDVLFEQAEREQKGIKGQKAAKEAREKGEQLRKEKAEKEKIKSLEDAAEDEKLKRQREAMTAEERHNALIRERIKLEEEYKNIDPKSVEGAEKRLEIQKAITAEEKARKALQGTVGDELEDFFSDLDDQEEAINKELERQAKKREEIADINARIAEEQKGREEAGMTPEELQERRTSEAEKSIAELAELRKKALEDGKVDLDEEKDIASKRLEAEEAITAASTQDTGGADPSIISSALASIGAGGGTAMFTQDPLLNENKRQTDLLAKISSALGAGDGTRGNPEL